MKKLIVLILVLILVAIPVVAQEMTPQVYFPLIMRAYSPPPGPAPTRPPPRPPYGVSVQTDTVFVRDRIGGEIE